MLLTIVLNKNEESRAHSTLTSKVQRSDFTPALSHDQVLKNASDQKLMSYQPTYPTGTGKGCQDKLNQDKLIQDKFIIHHHIAQPSY